MCSANVPVWHRRNSTVLAPEAPCAIARTRELLLRPGACCPCPPGVPCRAAAQLGCVSGCLRRAQQLHLGSAWSALRLIGAELYACADSIVPDGEVDTAELTRFAQHCFVSPGVDPDDDPDQLYLMHLVQDCKVA